MKIAWDSRKQKFVYVKFGVTVKPGSPDWRSLKRGPLTDEQRKSMEDWDEKLTTGWGKLRQKTT